jgi:hypothetical protein
VDPDGNIVMLPVLAYLAYTSIQTAVDVGIDRGIAGLTGDKDFSYTKSLATNFVINAATGGVGGKMKNAGKIAKFATETAIDATVTTAYEAGVEGKDAGSTFVENAASGVVGRAIGDKAAKHLTKSKLNVERKSAPVGAMKSMSARTDSELGLPNNFLDQNPFPKGVIPKQTVEPEGTLIKMYQSSKDIQKNRIGGYAIDAAANISDKEIRNKAAITTEFKAKGELEYESIFRVKPGGMNSRRGSIGPQYDYKDNFSYYSGSDIPQIEIDKSIRPEDRSKYLERVGKPRKLDVEE